MRSVEPSDSNRRRASSANPQNKSLCACIHFLLFSDPVRCAASQMLPQSSAASKLRRTLKTASCDVMVEINRRILIKEGNSDGGGCRAGRSKSAEEVRGLVLAFEQVQDKLDNLRAQNREAAR